jgi:hypothetical protein
MKRVSLLLSLFLLCACEQETVADKAQRIEAGCEREFLPDVYRSNQCKIRLLLELRQQVDRNRLDNARRY